MYLDFLILISDYYKTVDRRVFIYEWGIPFFIAIFILVLLFFNGTTSSYQTYNTNLVRLFAVLVGFSITIITILTTGQSKNLEEIKKNIIDVRINGKKISLFRFLIINFTYTVIIEILLIIFCLISPIIIENISLRNEIKYIGFSILVALTLHVLLLTIRNLTDFCLIITK